MEFIRFKEKNRIRTGIKCKGYYLDLEEAYKFINNTSCSDQKIKGEKEHPSLIGMTSIIAAGKKTLDLAKEIESFIVKEMEKGKTVDLEEKGIIFSENTDKLMMPIEKPCNVLGLYSFSLPDSEVVSIDSQQPKELPVIFMQPDTALVGPGEAMVLRDFNKDPKWRIELGIIIGKECYKVPASEIEQYIFGYTVVTSMEDQQHFIDHIKEHQPELNYRDIKVVKYFATCQDTFISVGPHILTKDKIDKNNILEAVMSDSNGNTTIRNSTDPIKSIMDTIAFISGFMTLKPGDLIHAAIFGTIGNNDGIRRIQSEITGLGIQQNMVVNNKI